VPSRRAIIAAQGVGVLWVIKSPSPLQGLPPPAAHPGLAPWATVLRRFATESTDAWNRYRPCARSRRRRSGFVLPHLPALWLPQFEPGLNLENGSTDISIKVGPGPIFAPISKRTSHKNIILTNVQKVKRIPRDFSVRCNRHVIAGEVYHVLNRGNGRITLFHKWGIVTRLFASYGGGLSDLAFGYLSGTRIRAHRKSVVTPFPFPIHVLKFVDHASNCASRTERKLAMMKSFSSKFSGRHSTRSVSPESPLHSGYSAQVDGG